MVAVCKRASLAAVAVLAAGAAGRAMFACRAFASAPNVGSSLGPSSLRGGKGQQQHPEDAGLGSTASFGMLATVAVGAAAAVRLGSLVIRHRRRVTSWQQKQWQNADHLRRNPPPTLTDRELRKRIVKIKLARRADVASLPMGVYFDPRDEEFQLPLHEAKMLLETPGYVVEHDKRTQIGAPPPVFHPMDDALAVIRGKQQMGGAAKRQAAEAAEKAEKEGEGGDGETKKRAGGAKGKKGGVDLSDIDMDFVNYKGIQLSKKQIAKMQSKDKGRA